MNKIFRKMRWRIAKKHIIDRRKCFAWRVNKLSWAINVKPGDIINSCDLLNHVVDEVHPCWYRPQGFRKGYILVNVDFRGSDGMMCSTIGCGVTPALNEEQLLKQFKEYDWEPEKNDWLHRLVVLMESGVRVLDDRLLLKPEFLKMKLDEAHVYQVAEPLP